MIELCCGHIENMTLSIKPKMKNYTENLDCNPLVNIQIILNKNTLIFVENLKGGSWA